MSKVPWAGPSDLSLHTINQRDTKAEGYSSTKLFSVFSCPFRHFLSKHPAGTELHIAIVMFLVWKPPCNFPALSLEARMTPIQQEDSSSLTLLKISPLILGHVHRLQRELQIFLTAGQCVVAPSAPPCRKIWCLLSPSFSLPTGLLPIWHIYCKTEYIRPEEISLS